MRYKLAHALVRLATRIDPKLSIAHKVNITGGLEVYTQHSIISNVYVKSSPDFGITIDTSEEEE